MLFLKIIKPIKNINDHIKKLGIKSLKLKTFNIDKIKITKVMRYVLKVEISRQTSLENSVLITKKIQNEVANAIADPDEPNIGTKK